MLDTIAIFKHAGRCAVQFCIDGQWWPVSDDAGHIRCWDTEQEARAHLDQAQRYYHTRHGESLGWNVDAIPVIKL